MSNRFLPFLLIAALGTGACGDTSPSDPGDEGGTAWLVGTWNVVRWAGQSLPIVDQGAWFDCTDYDISEMKDIWSEHRIDHLWIRFDSNGKVYTGGEGASRCIYVGQDDVRIETEWEPEVSVQGPANYTVTNNSVTIYGSDPGNPSNIGTRSGGRLIVEVVGSGGVMMELERR